MKTKFLKTTLSYILALTLLMLAGFGLINIMRPTFKTYAATNQNEVTISNSNFDSNTSGSYPISPNSFKPSRNEDNSGVEAGVIDLEDADYEGKFKTNDLSNDSYVLMIDSKNAGSDFGYTTDSAVKLDKSSNYMFTVDVYTDNNNGIANLYLMQDDKVYSSITNISSLNNWTTYSFFISTNDVDELNLKLRLNAKNAGVALFDNISCAKLSNDELARRMNTDANLYSYKDESESNLVESIDLSNNVFSNFAMGSGRTIEGKANDSISFDGTVSSAFKIKNERANYAKYETSDDFITVPQNRIYKISLMVKTRNLSGNANLKLVQTNLEEGVEGKDSEVIKITSDTGSKTNLTNDYQEYSFYVFGYTNKTATYKLVIGLGDSDDENMTSGEMYLTRATITNVTYSIFKNASTGSTAQKIDLNATETADSSIYLTNGKFNQFEITDLTNPLPATPSSWSVGLGKGEQKYGVVNTSESEWNNLSSLNMTHLSNPNKTNENENVLMMYNASKDTLSYTSPSKNLSAKTYHRFSVRVQTQNSPIALSLITKKDSKEITLSSIDVLTNVGEWKTVELYIYTGLSSLDVSLKATLDSKRYAYCYLDDATIDQYGAPEKETFDDLTNNETRVKTDLSNILSSSENKNWATPNLVSAETVGNVKFGIINLNNSDLEQEVTGPDYLNRFLSLNSDNKDIVGISTLEDTSYTATSLLGLKLTAGSYYQLNVSVFTKDIKVVDSKNLREADENGKVLYGAGLALTGFDNKFTNIISDGTWATYSFYINPTDDTTTYLEFSLGETDALVSGDVFFSGIELIESDETTFNSKGENKFTKVIKPVSTTEEKNEEENNEEENKNEEETNKKSYNWLYLLPTLVMVLAVIIAIIGIALRKIKWKKPRKKSKNEYDRNKTVSKQVYERKAGAIRQDKLRELNKELAELNAERSKYEENYKRDISLLREMKIKRADQAEINKLNKSMKKDQKSASSLGLSISKLESEIEYVNSPAFINSVMKKLENETTSDTNPNETK